MARARWIYSFAILIGNAFTYICDSITRRGIELSSSRLVEILLFIVFPLFLPIISLARENERYLIVVMVQYLRKNLKFDVVLCSNSGNESLCNPTVFLKISLSNHNRPPNHTNVYKIILIAICCLSAALAEIYTY